jgi:predicted nucleic acid-binding protein
VYLDANILFSASLKTNSRFLQFWKRRDLIPITSIYAADETRRNCVSQAHLGRLEILLEQTHFVSDIPGAGMPSGMDLPPKDVPILTAAIHAGSDYLITGDTNHFGKWMNIPIDTHLGTLLIQEPGRFLDEHLDPL